MERSGRYDTSGLVEGQLEPGSRGRVLKNKLGITGRRLMDEVEAREQLRVLQKFVAIYECEHRFTAAEICSMHKVWLGMDYEYEPMQKILRAVIKRTLRQQKK